MLRDAMRSCLNTYTEQFGARRRSRSAHTPAGPCLSREVGCLSDGGPEQPARPSQAALLGSTQVTVVRPAATANVSGDDSNRLSTAPQRWRYWVGWHGWQSVRAGLSALSNDRRQLAACSSLFFSFLASLRLLCFRANKPNHGRIRQAETRTGPGPRRRPHGMA